MSFDTIIIDLCSLNYKWIVKAYGFAKRKLLDEHLGTPHSTFSTWVSRSFFPAELVIRCVKETGARLDYVVYGNEPVFDNIENSHVIRYITVLPAGKIRVDGGKFSFECELSDINVVGKVILKMEKM